MAIAKKKVDADIEAALVSSEELETKVGAQNELSEEVVEGKESPDDLMFTPNHYEYLGRKTVESFLKSQRELIYERMSAAMADVDAIVKKKEKDSKVPYAFRSIEDVMNAIHPILVKHQIFIVPNVIQTEHSTFEKIKPGYQGGASTIQNNFQAVFRSEYRFYTIDGSYVTASMEAESIDQADKATQQASSYCYKNVILQVFCIPTKDLISDGDDKMPDRTNETPTGKKLADSKLADRPTATQQMAKDAVAAVPDVFSPEDFVVLKKWLAIFAPYGLTADTFNDWMRATLAANHITIPDDFKKLSRVAGAKLIEVATVCYNKKSLVNTVDQDPTTGKIVIPPPTPEPEVIVGEPVLDDVPETVGYEPPATFAGPPIEVGQEPGIRDGS